MLDCLKLDIEILDVDIENVESNNYREVSRDDGDTNGVLAAIQGGARSPLKDRWKFIDPFTQSISGLCWASQLYPRIKEQKGLSKVT